MPIRGIYWYWRVGLVRRFRENFEVYCSIASAAFLVFILVGLNETAHRESQSNLMVGNSNAQYVEYATTWLMVMGALVAFLQTQFLIQRLIEDRYIQFGFLLNIGTPRVIVGILISLEQISHSVVGGFIGILAGVATIALVSLTPSYISPTSRSVAIASASAIIVPLLTIFPMSITLLIRLVRSAKGVRRVR